MDGQIKAILEPVGEERTYLDSLLLKVDRLDSKKDYDGIIGVVQQELVSNAPKYSHGGRVFVRRRLMYALAHALDFKARSIDANDLEEGMKIFRRAMACYCEANKMVTSVAEYARKMATALDPGTGKTNALVVIHTETSYSDTDRNSGLNRDELFVRIALEIGKFVRNGNRVYFLPEKARSPESQLIPEAIRAHSSDMVFLPYTRSQDFPTAESQFLMVKELLAIDRVDKILLAGVSYGVCVSGLYALLKGTVTEGLDIGDGIHLFSRAGYRERSELLGWSPEKFEDVSNRKMNVEVRADLTNMPVQPAHAKAY